MNGIKPQQLDNCKRRIGQRLEESTSEDRGQPMFNPENVHYEMAERARGLAAGGIGAVHQLALKIGLVDRIDRDLHLLKIHRPYHESDHVLNIALNVMAGGECLEDLELRRNDEVFLDALGTQRIPDPTTAGDFCRRFSEGDVRALMDAIDETRLEIWKQQSDDFFDEAIIDMDGTMVPTTGECKEGMDISYKGEWGYHPLTHTRPRRWPTWRRSSKLYNTRPTNETRTREGATCALVPAGDFPRLNSRGPIEVWPNAHHLAPISFVARPHPGTGRRTAVEAF